MSVWDCWDEEDAGGLMRSRSAQGAAYDNHMIGPKNENDRRDEQGFLVVVVVDENSG